MVVVVLNGLLGNRKNRMDVTDLVRIATRRLPDRRGLKIIRGRGGSGIGYFNGIYQELEEHSKNDEALCLIGKGCGAHWCVQLLQKLAEHEKLSGFRAVGMVTLAPISVLQRKKRSLPEIDWAKNFHEQGSRRGYLLGPPAENIAVNAKHGDLERVRAVHRGVEDLLMWGRVKDRAIRR